MIRTLIRYVVQREYLASRGTTRWVDMSAHTGPEAGLEQLAYQRKRNQTGDAFRLIVRHTKTTEFPYENQGDDDEE